MKVDRIVRVNELLKREIAMLLFQIMREEAFDLAAVTVTHVTTGRDLRDATVHVSIRAEEKDQKRMLGLLQGHRAKMQQHINRHIGLKYTPRLIFRLDKSVAKGDRILGLLAQMDHSEESPETP